MAKLHYLADIDPRTVQWSGVSMRETREQQIIEILKQEPDAWFRYYDRKSGWMITEKHVMPPKPRTKNAASAGSTANHTAKSTRR